MKNINSLGLRAWKKQIKIVDYLKCKYEWWKLIVSPRADMVNKYFMGGPNATLKKEYLS